MNGDFEKRADERGLKKAMAAGCLVNKSLACDFTLISEISVGSVLTTAVHMGTPHLHASNTDVARSYKELNTVDYGKMMKRPWKNNLTPISM